MKHDHTNKQIRALAHPFAAIADRRHVGEEFGETLRYAVSRLARGVWANLSSAQRRILRRALRNRVTANRKQYSQVMSGTK